MTDLAQRVWDLEDRLGRVLARLCRRDGHDWSDSRRLEGPAIGQVKDWRVCRLCGQQDTQPVGTTEVEGGAPVV